MELLPLHHYKEYTDQCCYILNEHWPILKSVRMNILKRSCDSLPTSLVLVKAGVAIGHARIKHLDSLPQAVYIESVIISKILRGRGFGKILMEKIEDYVRILGFKTAYLSTHDQMGFYGRLGYTFCSPVALNAKPLHDGWLPDISALSKFSLINRNRTKGSVVTNHRDVDNELEDHKNCILEMSTSYSNANSRSSQALIPIHTEVNNNEDKVLLCNQISDNNKSKQQDELSGCSVLSLCDDDIGFPCSSEQRSIPKPPLLHSTKNFQDHHSESNFQSSQYPALLKESVHCDSSSSIPEAPPLPPLKFGNKQTFVAMTNFPSRPSTFSSSTSSCENNCMIFQTDDEAISAAAILPNTVKNTNLDIDIEVRFGLELKLDKKGKFKIYMKKDL